MSTKLIVGNKYVPHQKTAYDTGLESSGVWKRAQENKQPYLYYLGTSSEGYHRFSDSMDDAADYFNEDDVTPYIEELPEKWTVAITKETIDNVNKLRVAEDRPAIDVGDYEYIDNEVSGLENKRYVGDNRPCAKCTLITAEQFNNYFNKTQTVMSTQSISRKNLQTIHSKVCSKWQGRIEEELKANLFADVIEVDNDLISEAFREADKDQLVLLSKYFKIPGSEYMTLVENLSSCFNPEVFYTDHIQIGNTAVETKYKGRSIIFDPSQVEAIIMDNPKGNSLSKMIVFKTK
jgi:hypothetical protein